MNDGVTPPARSKQHGPGSRVWLPLAGTLQVLAGLLGAGGVAVAAAAAHHGGGDITAIAANMMLIHAGAVIAVTTAVRSSAGRKSLILSAALLLLGTALFSGELALAGLTGLRPWPFAAPLGGSMMIVGWLAVAASFAVGLRQTR